MFDTQFDTVNTFFNKYLGYFHDFSVKYFMLLYNVLYIHVDVYNFNNFTII